MKTGEGALLIWNDIAPGKEPAFRAWHDEEHIPERMRVPGFRFGRRLFGLEATPRWLTIYEAASPAVFTSPDYVGRLNHPTPRTRAILPWFRNTQRMAGEVVADAGNRRGAVIFTIRIWRPPAAMTSPAALQRLVETAACSAASVSAALAGTAGTAMATTERSLRGPDQAPPDLVLVAEAPAGIAFAWPDELAGLAEGAGEVRADRFDLEFALSAIDPNPAS